jgi:phenylalanyl-tRNA synthetase beta chain
MQFPESWLREYCNPSIDTTALAQVLTMAGMEVEEARPAAPPFRGVVVAEVLAVERHPNADRLSVCRVDVGRGDALTIVCGAPNVRPGIKVPCALVGAELPAADGAKGDAAPFVIRLGQLRGVESQGMLCSARELKLSDDHGGLLVLESSAKVGDDIRAHLKLDDTLLTLKLTPNLAHCLSVYGIARELSALTGAPLRAPEMPPVAVDCSDRLPVAIEAFDLCGRFSGRVVRDVDTQATTPAWMVDRLARCGQRSVNALVDISNYVMFETGQPTHIFDLDKIAGGLTVRWGRVGESLKLLNGSTVMLDEKVGVIADANGVESLAGIMGGDATAVSDATRNVYVEAAFWWPEAVAGRSRRYNFATDAGHRFERGVDPALTAAHVERITQLIVEICGGSAGPADDQVVNMPKREPVTLRVERAGKVSGMPLTQRRCEDVMRRLGFDFTSEPGVLTVTPPSWRFDLRIEEDLIEEVIRLIGYDALPDAPPDARLVPRVLSESRRGLDAVRERMAALDYQETINFSFVDERWERDLAGNATPIRLVNPMAGHMAVMRSSLVGSLIGVLQLNLARKAARVRVFEAGRAFLRSAAVVDGDTSVAGVDQPMRLAGLAYGSADALQWGIKERAVDFFDLKGDVEALLAPREPRFVPDMHPAMHPGRCARVELDGRAIGHAGELHPKWRQAYELPMAPLLFELDVEALLQRVLPAYAAVQRHQSVWRDLSVIVGPQVTHEALKQAIASANSAGLVRSMRLFDVYRPSAPAGDLGSEERSLSVRLELLDDAVTLTEERIDAAVADVLTALMRRLGARLRS